MARFSLLLVAGVSALALSSAAHAADLIIEEPAEVGVVESTTSWDGAFIGVFTGYGFGELTGDFSGEETAGWLLGVDAGVNFTLTEGIVVGVVGDVAWSNLTNVDFEDVTLDWTASLRGRVGFDGGAFMPYLTAGVAAGGGHFVFTDGSATHFGWTVGAGVEFAVTEDVSIDLLYRYTDLGEQNLDGPDIGFETHSVTAGLHWNF